MTAWLVLLSLVVVAGAGAAVYWFANSEGEGPRAVAVAPSVAPPASRPTESNHPSTGGVTTEQVAHALAEAPLLTPDAAQALLEDVARHGQAGANALDEALFVVSAGLPDLDRATLAELGELFAKAWGTRPASAQDRISAYVAHARRGAPTSPEVVSEGRALFVEGVRALPDSTQVRLRLLFARALVAGIAHRERAEERTQLAALNQATPAPAVPAGEAEPRGRLGVDGAAASASGRAHAVAVSSEGDEPTASRSVTMSEDYWRSRAANARATLAASEKRVRDLEQELARAGTERGPYIAACQTGAPADGQGLLGRRSAWERTQTVVTCDPDVLRRQNAPNTSAQLDRAREDLKRAQQAMSDLEDEARRAGALPGWLR